MANKQAPTRNLSLANQMAETRTSTGATRALNSQQQRARLLDLLGSAIALINDDMDLKNKGTRAARTNSCPQSTDNLGGLLATCTTTGQEAVAMRLSHSDSRLPVFATAVSNEPTMATTSAEDDAFVTSNNQKKNDQEGEEPSSSSKN